MGVILSARDAKRLQDCLRWYERTAEKVKPVYSTKKDRGGGGGGLSLAYCKTAAGTGATIVCFLDTDTTGLEITVTCKLYEGGTNLSGCAPLLVDGDLMLVFSDGTYWRSLTTFIKADTCE